MDCVTDTYVTFEHQTCCVTLVAIENNYVDKAFCGNFASGDLTVNLGNEDCEEACLDKRQGSRVHVPKETSFSEFIAIKIRQHFLNLNNSVQNFNNNNNI